VYSISGQQSTKLLTLQIPNDSLDLKSATSLYLIWPTHLLDDGTEYSIEGKHDIPFSAKHDSQQILESVGIDLAIKQLLRRHEEVVVVLLGGVVAMLNTEVLDVGFGKTKLDGCWVDGLSSGSSEFFGQVLAGQ
jgi:hypothetical protein